MKKKKLIIIIAAILLVAAAAGVATFLLLRGGGGGGGGEGGEVKEEPPRKTVKAPAEYVITGVNLPALPVLSEEISVYKEELTAGKTEEEGKEGEEGEEGEETAPPQDPGYTKDAVGYRYEGLADAGELARAYIALMTAKGTGFESVDQALVRSSLPELEGDEGAVRLARPSTEEGKVMLLDISWTKDACTVIADSPEGEITDPPEPEPMTLSEAGEYIQSLSPAQLGLEGSSMKDYRVYTNNGIAMVNGNLCISFTICRRDEDTDTNDAAGTYFLSADRRHIYRLIASDGSVEELTGE